MSATKEQMDSILKTVAELAEEVKKGQSKSEAEQKAKQDEIVEIVRNVVKEMPGFNANRKVEFEASPDSKERAETDILGSMPKELQQEVDNLLILSKVCKTPVQNLKSWQTFKRRAGDYKKALDTAASGGGAEWVPTGFTNSLFELVSLEARVAGQFSSIQMPTNPYTLPIQVGRVGTFKQPEQTADTGQTKIPVGDGSSITGSTTLTAVGHAARVLVSKETEEDSIIPILPFLQRDIAIALAEGRDDAILNGDTAGTHEDADVTAATDRKKLWLGLRAGANDNTYKTDLGTFSTANLRVMRAAMGKYGVNPNEMVLITGPVGYSKLLGLTEVLTVDKLGDKATLLSGQLASFDGMPIIVSGQVRENLNASGVQDGVTTTKTVLYMVNRRGYVLGERRRDSGVRLLTELYAESDQDVILTKERLVFSAVYPLASNTVVRLGYNIA